MPWTVDRESTGEGEADSLMRAMEAARAANGLSKAALARRSHFPPETVRRLLTARGTNPTLGTVLGLLKPLGLGLRLAALPSVSGEVSAEPPDVRAWLSFYGAPLYGATTVDERNVPRPEYVLAEALALAREDASVARALPLALFRVRRRLDLGLLRRLAEERGQGRALGFFLELTAALTKAPALARAARPLRALTKRKRATQFFKVRSRRERSLAELKTPPLARRWGFKMNMSQDSFESMFRKAAAERSSRSRGSAESPGSRQRRA